MDWLKYSFVIRGKNRKAVLLTLSNPKTPTQIAERLKLNLSKVSRALKELEREGLIECLTPDEKVGRLYRRTSIGEKIAEMIKLE
jgi:DNA-binding MarR family transcriptional regulator